MTRPAKPYALNRRHDTLSDKKQRAENEKAMTPSQPLPMDAPSLFTQPITAAGVWRWLMRAYSELDAQIVTRLDQHLLTDYCRLMEQAYQLDQERERIAGDLEAAHQAGKEAGELAAMRDLLLKYDARIDRKKALLLQWRQSLYLTPRARAGAAPTKKEAEEPIDPMEALLNDVSNFMNSPNK